MSSKMISEVEIPIAHLSEIFNEVLVVRCSLLTSKCQVSSSPMKCLLNNDCQEKIQEVYLQKKITVIL